MSIDRRDAERRLQAALNAWRKVAESRRIVAAAAQADGEEDPGGTFLDDQQLEELADGFDLMARIWWELEHLSPGDGSAAIVKRPNRHDRARITQELPGKPE